MERLLFRCEIIIINNPARPSLSELQNSNLRLKFLNCRGWDSSQKNTMAFNSSSTTDSSFYADARRLHQSAGRKVFPRYLHIFLSETLQHALRLYLNENVGRLIFQLSISFWISVPRSVLHLTSEFYDAQKKRRDEFGETCVVKEQVDYINCYMEINTHK